MFLKGSNWNGWTDRQWEVVPKRRGTRVKSSGTSIGLDPRDWQTIIIVWSQWMGWKWCSKHGVKINRLFFTQGFVGQQIYLKKYPKPYLPYTVYTMHTSYVCAYLICLQAKACAIVTMYRNRKWHPGQPYSLNSTQRHLYSYCPAINDSRSRASVSYVTPHLWPIWRHIQVVVTWLETAKSSSNTQCASKTRYNENSRRVSFDNEPAATIFIQVSHFSCRWEGVCGGARESALQW